MKRESPEPGKRHRDFFFLGWFWSKNSNNRQPSRFPPALCTGVWWSNGKKLLVTRSGLVPVSTPTLPLHWPVCADVSFQDLWDTLGQKAKVGIPVKHWRRHGGRWTCRRSSPSGRRGVSGRWKRQWGRCWVMICNLFYSYVAIRYWPNSGIIALWLQQLLKPFLKLHSSSSHITYTIELTARYVVRQGRLLAELMVELEPW